MVNLIFFLRWMGYWGWKNVIIYIIYVIIMSWRHFIFFLIIFSVNFFFIKFIFASWKRSNLPLQMAATGSLKSQLCLFTSGKNSWSSDLRVGWSAGFPAGWMAWLEWLAFSLICDAYEFHYRCNLGMFGRIPIPTSLKRAWSGSHSMCFNISRNRFLYATVSTNIIIFAHPLLTFKIAKDSD